MNVLPIAEARRRLPELVRKVAAGHPPIAIGTLRGLIEILGDLEVRTSTKQGAWASYAIPLIG